MRIRQNNIDHSTEGHTLRETSAVSATSLQRGCGLSALAEGGGMSKAERTTAQESFKQAAWAGDRESKMRSLARRLEAEGLEVHPAVDWAALKPVAPDHACPICRRLNSVFNADDICVVCRTVEERPDVVIERRGTGEMAEGRA